jgi:mercuric reductase
MTEACCAPRSAPQQGHDLVVIGAGSAGFSAAIRATELGARVLLVGHGRIGGTCVNVGCVPSKTLIRATEAVHAARFGRRFAGIDANAQILDWSAAVKQKDELVESLRQTKYVDLLPQYPKVTYVYGPAQLTQRGLSLNGREIAADKIVIATGSRPAQPPISGLTNVPYLTSTTALSLDKLPRSLLVLGAGYVGTELAQMFARAGVAVTLACRSRLVPTAELEVSAALSRYFRAEGIEIREGLTYRSLRRTATGIVLEASQEDAPVMIEAEQLLLATGRQPNISELELEQAGVERTIEGAIKIDSHMETSKPGVYAVGDVTGRDQFVYMAAYGAKLATENALQGNRRSYDSTSMPAIVFTDPQVASVGLTERQARAEGLQVKTSVIGLENVPRALAARDTRGLIKLIADRKDGRLLGAHILAPEGADSIQTAVLAIKHRLSVKDLADTLFPYLTTVEGLKLAAQAFDKDVSKLSCCAG